MSDFLQVLVMMATPATVLFALRQINLRADRAVATTEHRPTQ